MYLLFLIEMNINVLHCDGYEQNSCFFFSENQTNTGSENSHFSNVRATNTYIYFHVKIFFPDVLLHDLPSSLYNRNVYRKDKLHKGNFTREMTFLPNGSTTAFPMPVLQLIPLSTLPL